MFGLVVHANILATILNEDYIDGLPEWATYFIAFLFCFFNVALFYALNHRYPLWFDSVSLVIQIAQIVLLVGFSVWLFSESNCLMLSIL